MFCGCSDNSANTIETNSVIAEEEVVTEEISTEPVIEEPAVDVDWQTLTYQWTDDSGYTFEATVRVSPWINTKNEAYVNAAWDEVGQGNSLPKANASSWGLSESSNGYGRYNDEYGSFRPIQNITDTYYCVGNISVKNLTTGWDITNSSPVTSDTIWLSACQPKPDTKEVQRHPSLQENYTRSSTVSKVFCGNKTTNPTWAVINPKYNSNTWGPAAFVFAHFDNKTPANPNGECMSEITDTYFCINSIDYCIWEKEMDELTTAKLSIVE